MSNGAIPIPDDLVIPLLQAMLGQDYVSWLGLGISALLVGYMFFSYKFVIRGKNNKNWLKIREIDKCIISFFMGFALYIIGISSMVMVLSFQKISFLMVVG